MCSLVVTKWFVFLHFPHNSIYLYFRFDYFNLEIDRNICMECWNIQKMMEWIVSVAMVILFLIEINPLAQARIMSFHATTNSFRCKLI